MNCYNHKREPLQTAWFMESIIPRSKNHLDCNLDCNLVCNPEDVPVYMGHSLFKRTKRIIVLFIVQSLLHRNRPNIWIKIIKIKCLHETKFLDPDHDLDRNPDNFALYFKTGYFSSPQQQ